MRSRRYGTCQTMMCSTGIAGRVATARYRRGTPARNSIEAPKITRQAMVPKSLPIRISNAKMPTTPSGGSNTGIWWSLAR